MMDKPSIRRVLRKRAFWTSTFLSLALWVPAALAWEWHIETVDSVGHVGQYTSLALDTVGFPHISYYDSSKTDLKYAYLDASGWHVENADTAGNVGPHTSLALDGSARPHISYCHDDYPDCDVKYAYRDGSGWHVESVDSALGLHGGYTSLALDGWGCPHISYHGTGGLQYAYRDASGWHAETVDEWGYLGCTSLALDGAARPHISYCGGPSKPGELRYACRDSSGWHTETAYCASVSHGHPGRYASLALDGSGRPHVSHTTKSGRSLLYTLQDASGWHTETVDTALGYHGGHTSLALEGSGSPYISYYESTNTDLKCAYRDATGWHIELVDAAGDAGGYTSLALDASGRPRISYYDGTNEDLKYAYASGAAHAEDPHRRFPGTLQLLRVSPNPATTGAAILYDLSGSVDTGRRVCLRVLDPLGRLVAVPAVPRAGAGTHSAWWDLSSSDGSCVSPGVYYLRLETGDPEGSAVGKLVVIR